MYQAILDYHYRERRLVLDVGTGPGKALFDMLPHFERGIGTDTSPQMIEQAGRDAAALGLAERTRFNVGRGEDCTGSLTPDEIGEVDLITVAMTAHWLDMPAFYAAAARALRPSGTLAIWTCSNGYVHPRTPDAAKIQEILFDLQRNMLGPYSTPGNEISDQAYKTLPLPWSIAPPSSDFFEADFMRHDWDLDGVPSAPPLPDGTPGPFIGEENEDDLDTLRHALGSASMVVRWRAANPDKAHTDQDCVNLTIARLREVVGGNKIATAGSYSLLLFRAKPTCV